MRRARRILFVCLGNICRSPTAEGVLRSVAAGHPRVALEIDSAGTADYHVGDPPDVRTQRAALRRGIDLSALRARQVVARDFAEFDLILAMDRKNLRDLESLRPPHSPASLGLFLDYAPELGVRELPDPYYGGASDFERVLDLALAASQELMAALEDEAAP